VRAVETAEDTALTVWADFLRVHATLTDLLGRELIDGRGIPLGWYDVLVQLEMAGGQLRMQDLAAAVVLSKSGLTRLVDRLEEARYVRRVSCPSDRRGTFAEITDDGRAVLEQARPLHLRGVAEHFTANLDRDELASLGRALKSLLQAHGVPTASGRECAGPPAQA
jgi:DNA-binding MarR family transcriptional regulator